MTDPVSPAAPANAVSALAYGWKTFRENVRPLLLVVAVPVVAQLVIALAGRILISSIAKWFLFQIVGIIVSTILGIGAARLALAITAGETADAGAAFRYDRWGPWIAFAAVFGVLEGVGLVLCVIPGVLFLAFFGLAPYYFLDRSASIGAALRASRDAVTGNGLAFAVLLSIVIGVLGAVVFFVGVFVTQAVAALALAFLYRHVSGTPVAAAPVVGEPDAV